MLLGDKMAFDNMVWVSYSTLPNFALALLA